MQNLMYMLAASGEISGIPAAVRQVLEPLFMILMVLLSIATIVIILMQKSQQDNVSAISGETETFLGKNKGSSKESKLKLATFILGGLLLVVSVIFFIITSR